MKRWHGYLLLGVGAYLFFLVWQLPAAFVWAQFGPSLDRQLPRLEISGVQGRIWRGEIASLRYAGEELGSLSWRFSPWSLLVGELRLPLMLQRPQGYVETRLVAPLDLRRLTLLDTRGQLPASELQRHFPYYPVAIDGTIALNIPLVQVNSASAVEQLEGEVNWLGAEVLAPQAMRLGDLRAQLGVAQDGEVTARLADRGGPLSLDGTFGIRLDGGYRLSGSVAAAEGAEASLRQSLGWLGKPDNGGHYRLNLRGRLGS